MTKTVSFSKMEDGTREDWDFLVEHEVDHARHTADRLLKAVVELDSSLSGLKITRLEHCLQSATRAWQDGADIDWVVGALLHDIGDIYAPHNHDEYAATIIRPFVREQVAWCVQTHGDFQMIYYGHLLEGGNQNKREKHRKSPYFQDCVDFCANWDQVSFDPGYQHLPLDFFAPMVREVFDRNPHDPKVVQQGVRVALRDSAQAATR